MAHVINKLRFPSDFKANIMQEKDQKSFFDLYSGSKEIDFLEKLHLLSPIANLHRQSTGKLLFLSSGF